MRIRLMILFVLAAGLVTICARPSQPSAPSRDFGSIQKGSAVSESWEAPV